MILKTEKYVALYIRVSTEKQIQEGFSLDAQLEVTLKLATDLFGENITWKAYIDDGLSVKSTEKQANLHQMLRDVQSGKILAVITEKASRLSRTLSDALKIAEQIYLSHTRFISVKEGEYGNSHANLVFDTLASVAQDQREVLVENVQLEMTERAKEGLWNGGVVLGYKSVDKKLVIVPEEAEIIQLIFQKYVVDRWGTKRITNHLNSCGYRTKKSKLFTIASVSTILRNPVYKGYIRFNQVIDWNSKRRSGKNEDYLICRGIHEPIIDEALWDEAHDMCKTRSTGTPRQYSGTFPLTGMAKCPTCGSFMTSLYGSKRVDGTRKRYYVCGAYHNKGKSVCQPNLISADWLEQTVFQELSLKRNSTLFIKKIQEFIIEYNHSTNDNQQNAEQFLMKQLNDLESRKKRIQELFESGTSIYTETEATERLNEIRSQINSIKSALESLPNNDVIANDPEKSRNTSFIYLHLKDFHKLSVELEPSLFRRLIVSLIETIEIKNKIGIKVHYTFNHSGT